MPEARLENLLAGLVDCAPSGVVVQGISQDSRTVRPGWIFAALSGTLQDGRDHIPDAVARGACAILVEAAAPAAIRVPVIVVEGLRRKLSRIAGRFFGEPSHALDIVGITGTNGKTTCSHLIAHAMDRPGQRCGIIGTLGNGLPGALAPGSHTTPDAVGVQDTLSGFRAQGARAVSMEVSSHALDQGRVEALRFRVAVFTNLTRDHLDYHASLDHYAAAKARLFDFDDVAAAVINADDELGRALITRSRARRRTIGYGLAAGEVRATALSLHAAGLTLTVTTPTGSAVIESGLIGRFNAENLLAAFAVLLELGLTPSDAAERLRHAEAPCGRMERYGGGDQPLVVVDYAHTPDALGKALAALRAHTTGRLICVFGCGGDRDRGKRPLMGEIAARLADVVIVTDDNPRGESPAGIVAEIVSGIMAGTVTGMPSGPTIEHDRVAAIRIALTRARAGDAVLIAGKGHEAWQEVAGRRLPFSDQSVVRSLLGSAA